MKTKYLIGLVLSSVVFFSCMDQKKSENTANKANTFNYNVEQFADIKVLRYQIPGWENLTLKEQKLVYYLTKAGLSGRDIIWDQNYRHNLTIRKALENIYFNYEGDRNNEDWNNFEIYLKRVWFSNGIHHHYSNAKFTANFSSEYLSGLLAQTNTKLEGEAFDVASPPAFYPLQNQGEYWSTLVDFPQSGVFTLGFEPVMALDESLAEASWVLYPNPAEDLLSIEVRYINPLGTACRALDCAGRVVHQWKWGAAQKQNLDVSAWSNGLYVLEFSKEGQRHAVPFMKQ